MPEDIATFLADAGLVDGDSGWKSCIGFQPPEPDQVVTLTEYAGNPAQTKINLEQPGLQVRARGAAEFGFVAAYDQLIAIMDALVPRYPQESPFPRRINGVDYRAVIAAGSGPMLIGYDAQANRPELSINFIVWRSR